MSPVFEEKGLRYFMSKEGHYSEPYGTEIEASVAFRQYYHNAPNLKQ